MLGVLERRQRYGIGGTVSWVMNWFPVGQAHEKQEEDAEYRRCARWERSFKSSYGGVDWMEEEGGV